MRYIASTKLFTPNHALSSSDKGTRFATRHRLVVTGTPTEAGAFGHVENLQARSHHGDSLDHQHQHEGHEGNNPILRILGYR